MGVRIAVIADIHGNYHALSKVLEDIAESDVELIYCLGDIVSLGHQTNKVLNAISNLKDIKIIRGNHDEAVVNAYKEQSAEESGEEHEHHLYISKNIHLEHVHMLEKLPATIESRFSGHKILMTHYHLAEDSRYLPIDYNPTLEGMQNLYEKSSYNVVLFGHDHTVQHFEDEHRMFINPGALGVTVEPFAPYTIMDITPDGSIDLEFRKVAYDRASFVNELEKENPPALDFIFNVLLKEKR